jgi:putative salt-induced outer membrane protein YdiY
MPHPPSFASPVILARALRASALPGIVLALPAAHAQFQRPALTASIARLEIRPDGAWRGTLGAGFSAARGNTNSLGADLSLDAVRATNEDKLSLFGQVLYAESEKDGSSVTTADQWRLGRRQDWGQKDSQFYLFGSGTVERDTMRQLDLRTTVGAGVGYRLLREPDRSFEVFSGLGYRGDRYRPPGSLVEGRLVDRAESLELMLGEESARRLTGNTSWQQRLMVFPHLSTSGAFRLTFESVLSVAMSRNLNLTVSLIDRYDSQAAVPLKKNDLLILTGINLRYGAR